jgi:hypothetical protein
MGEALRQFLAAGNSILGKIMHLAKARFMPLALVVGTICAALPATPF